MNNKTLKDLRSWIILNSIPGVGSSVFQKLLALFGSPESVLSASYSELCRIKGLDDNLARCIIEGKCVVDPDIEIELAKKYDCKLITLADEVYPTNLKNIPDPPPILYVKGDILNLNRDSLSIAIVGSRNFTSYGKAVCEFFSKELANMGFTIISGMAKGVDTIAHKSALEANGRTIAVLGNGLNRAYPMENENLMEKIALSGAVISEFSMKTKPMSDNFPRRNRLISGLALGVLVIEASEKSGSLITVSHALSQGREVFAVPGEIFSKGAKGSNYLIKQGAKLVDSIDDILEELEPAINIKTLKTLKTSAKPSQALDSPGLPEDLNLNLNLSEDEISILNILSLSHEPKHIDVICRTSNLPVGKASALLCRLEVRGLIKQIPGKLFLRK